MMQGLAGYQPPTQQQIIDPMEGTSGLAGINQGSPISIDPMTGNVSLPGLPANMQSAPAPIAPAMPTSAPKYTSFLGIPFPTPSTKQQEALDRSFSGGNKFNLNQEMNAERAAQNAPVQSAAAPEVAPAAPGGSPGIYRAHVAAAGGGGPISLLPSGTGGSGGVTGMSAYIKGGENVAKSIDEQAKLASEAGEHEALNATGIAGLKEEGAMLREKQATENKERADKRLAENEEALEGLRKQREATAAFKVDPNRYMKNQGVGTGLLAVAAGLAGAAQAFNHTGGPNPILEQINKNIDRDVDAQKNDQEVARQKGNDAENLYNLHLKATGNHEQATLLSQADARDVMAQHIESSAALAGGQKNQDAANFTAQGLRTEAEKERLQVLAAQIKAAGGGNADVEKAKSMAEAMIRAGDDPAHAFQISSATWLSHANPGAQLTAFVKPGGAAAANAEAVAQDAKQLGALQGAAQASMGAFSPTMIVPGSTASKAAESEKLYDEGIVSRFEAKGYSARQARAQAEPFMIHGLTDARKKERIASYLHGEQSGIFPRIKKGAGTGGENEETP